MRCQLAQFRSQSALLVWQCFFFIQKKIVKGRRAKLGHFNYRETTRWHLFLTPFQRGGRGAGVFERAKYSFYSSKRNRVWVNQLPTILAWTLLGGVVTRVPNVDDGGLYSIWAGPVFHPSLFSDRGPLPPSPPLPCLGKLAVPIFLSKAVSFSLLGERKLGERVSWVNAKGACKRCLHGMHSLCVMACLRWFAVDVSSHNFGWLALRVLL